MPTTSSLSEQLATLGLQRPAWPEECIGDGAAGDWIRQGQAYADGIRLWRAQLRRALAFEGTGEDRLIGTIRDVGRQSAWDQSVIRYLLAELQGSSDHQRVQTAARLVAAKDRTPAQRLGAALELAGGGFSVCALDAITLLVEHQQLSEQECLELCSLLVADLQMPSDSAEPDPKREGRQWLQRVTLRLEASSVLVTAARVACGEQNRAALVNQLNTLLALAAGSRPWPDSNERAAIEQVRSREQRKQSRSPGKPLLRTIHHLACTGGTAISKCLAAMPDVALISEVNPFNRCGSKFEPTNPLLLLERSYRPLSDNEILDDFARQIGHVHQICQSDDADLIIRDHSHTDFCMGAKPSLACPIVNRLGTEYELLSIATVRHPLDSYLGLTTQDWHTQFTPSTLEEYCKRYLAFLDHYASLPILRYEDFCARPEEFMENLCEILQIAYSAESLKRFGSFSLSGDSGRKGVEAIEPRPRRPVPGTVQVELKGSPHYSELVSRLGYSE